MFTCVIAILHVQVSGHLIQPLVTMVNELHRQQDELFKLLANKDKEIGDLKSQGVRVSRSKYFNSTTTTKVKCLTTKGIC